MKERKKERETKAQTGSKKDVVKEGGKYRRREH